MGSLLTWALLAFSDWVVVRHVIVSWFWTSRPRFDWCPLTDVGTVILVVYQLILGLSWFSHLQAMTTDPGTIKDAVAPDPATAKTCRLCHDRWKPPRAHHCKTCHRCIFRMDHHCPWINNCVGYSNQKLFILFLSYTALSGIVSLLLLVCSAIYWLWSQKSWSDAAPPGSGSLIFCGIVTVECLAVVLFVGDFLQEQIESIQMNSTLVETYQRTHGERTTFMEHFKGIFGQNVLVWPLPWCTAPPPNYNEPAIPDDAGGDDALTRLEDNENLGIAGDEYEHDGNRGSNLGAGGNPRPRHRPDVGRGEIE